MITGMTGFGASEAASGNVKASVEVKTVNHRYLDVAFYLPSGFSSFEEKIHKMVAKGIRRGRVTVSVKIIDKPHMVIRLNHDAVTRYRGFARQIAREFKVSDGLSAADILRLPGVVETKEMFVEAHTLWPAVEKGLAKAVAGVVAMRKREGKALCADISGQLKRMLKQIVLIKARSNALLKEKKRTLNREEFASYQKSNDINEELSRLTHYIDEAKALLRQSEGAGKKMDFIAQEMQRETNTIGSKVQDKDVAGAVIALKSKVEKIREQANNVE